jgi:sugar lactone lactonase YvrE
MKSFGLGAYVLSGGVAVSLLAGCGGLQTPIAAPYAMPQAPAAAGHTHSRSPALVRPANGDAHKPTSFLYLAQCCQQIFSNRGNITLYDLGLTGVARTITKGVSNPSFITVDRAGRLYMVSWDDLRGVTEYDAGSERPSRGIKLPDAWAAATDGSNNLYAAACPTCHPYGYGKGSVDVYEAGTTKLLRSITKGIDAPTSLAFDTDGNLYVLNYDGSKTAVVVYAPGSSKPLRRLPQGTTSPSAIALDPSSNLFVMSSNSSSPSIVEYKAASNKLLRIITKGLSSPQAMTLDGSGTLYVSNTPFPSRGWVSVYAAGTSTPSYQITSGMNDPQLLVVDGEGNLYVGNDDYGVALDRHETGSGDSGSVCAYAPKATTPLRCVATQQYSFPYALAVKPR